MHRHSHDDRPRFESLSKEGWGTFALGLLPGAGLVVALFSGLLCLSDWANGDPVDGMQVTLFVGVVLAQVYYAAAYVAL